MLLPTPLFPGCKKHDPVTVAIRTVNGKKGPGVSLNAGDIPIAPGSESSVQDEIKGIHGILSSTGSFRKIEDYLYEADCPLPNSELAEEHFRARFGKDAPPSAAGFAACSVLNHDGLIGRAYDWKYDEAVTFVVHTPANGDRFASVSICSSPAGITKESVEAHTVPASLWAVLPFYAVDGMNENGVTCSVCVVYGKGSEDILWHGKEFCAVGAVRYVLDRARTAEEGAGIIASEAWMPDSAKLGGYSLHFMVTDEAHTFVVEDGVVIDITDDDTKVMTNFRLGSRSFLDETGYADVNKIASYDPYGTGVERYNELVDYAKFASEETGMREWLRGFVYSDAYRESLLTGSTPRPSDFAGTEISRDHFVKINETEAIKAWFKSAKIHEKWVARERDGKFWQTVHSAVYDVASRMVSVVVQEGTAVHGFPIVREGGGSGTVKSVNNVEPDFGTGNVALTAHDIPYGGEGASNVETAIELNTQATVDNAEAIDSVEQQLGELKDDTYTKSEVDDKINQSAAHYLTKRAGTEGHYTYPQFATHADLAAAKAAHTEANPQFFYGDEAHTPDKNDYCTVLADETHGGGTTRYMFVGSWNDNGYFRYQYTINETAFTDEQWAAINSLVSVDEDGNLCFDGIPFINSSGELLFTEEDPIFTAWKNEVQIILGSGANIASGKYKQIAIGAHATANGQNAIAIGSSEPGGKTNGPRAMAQNAVAIGAGANATATNAVQIFAGTNNKSGTIQLGNKTVAFLSDIPITTADIDDYRYYKGHWSMGTTYKTGDIVRAERTVEGQEEKEVVYFKSLRDNNLAQNPFNEGSTYWTRTTDDEGLDKLSLFVKAAIAGMTGADISVSPTNADKIDVALGKKLDRTILTVDGQQVFKNGTEEITTYSELLALVKTGGVVLLDTVAGTIAKEALFHPHMADDTAIRFDATGTLGGKVYTRSFAFTPKSGGGIAISRGDLTELAKKSDVGGFVAERLPAGERFMVGRTFTNQDADNVAIVKSMDIPLAIFKQRFDIMNFIIQTAKNDSGIWDRTTGVEIFWDGDSSESPSDVNFPIDQQVDIPLSRTMYVISDRGSKLTIRFKGSYGVRLALVSVDPSLGYSITLSNGNVLNNYAPIIDFFGIFARHDAIDVMPQFVAMLSGFNTLPTNATMSQVIAKLNTIIKAMKE